jgi:hypothetical protein
MNFMTADKPYYMFCKKELKQEIFKQLVMIIDEQDFCRLETQTEKMTDMDYLGMVYEMTLVIKSDLMNKRATYNMNILVKENNKEE